MKTNNKTNTAHSVTFGDDEPLRRPKARVTKKKLATGRKVKAFEAATGKKCRRREKIPNTKQGEREVYLKSSGLCDVVSPYLARCRLCDEEILLSSIPKRKFYADPFRRHVTTRCAALTREEKSENVERQVSSTPRFELIRY